MTGAADVRRLFGSMTARHGDGRVPLLAAEEIRTEPIKWLKYLAMDRVGVEPISSVRRQISRFDRDHVSDAEQLCRTMLTAAGAAERGCMIVAKVVPRDRGAQLANHRMLQPDDVDLAFAAIRAAGLAPDEELWCCDSSVAVGGFNLGGRLTFPADGGTASLELVWHASPRLLESVSLPEFDRAYLRATRPPGSGFAVDVVHVPPNIDEFDVDDCAADLGSVLELLAPRVEAMGELVASVREIGAHEVCFCFKVSDGRLTVIDWDTEIESSAR
jgi:hypothetical protein